MLVNRSNGLANALAGALLLANSGLFLSMWQLWRLSPWNDPASHARLGAFLGAVFVGLFYASRRLFEHRSRITALTGVESIALSVRIVCGFLLGAALIYFLIGPIKPGRFFLVLFVISALPFNVLMLQALPRWLAWQFFRQDDRGRALLVGNGDLPSQLTGYIERCRMLGVEVTGHYGNKPVAGAAWPHLGSVEDLIAKAKTADPAGDPGDSGHPNCIVAYNFDHTAANFSKLVTFCHQRGIRLQAFARIANVPVEPVELVAEGELNFLVFMKEPLEDPLNRIIKRALDITVALPMVLLVLPCLTLLVWVMQRFQSPGPIIFRQYRYGANRKPFLIYKFRTMHPAMSDNGSEFKQASVDDPRVYPFGRFLRRKSLDEFPQFLNVLKGDMSVVGPRPHPLKLDQDMEASFVSYRSRHFVRPGITGYAQVLGLRGETADSKLLIERVRKDIQYISGWSLTFDLKILLQTTWQVIFPLKSAY